MAKKKKTITWTQQVTPVEKKMMFTLENLEFEHLCMQCVCTLSKGLNKYKHILPITIFKKKKKPLHYVMALS